MAQVKSDKEIRKELEKYYDNGTFRMEHKLIPGGVAALIEFMKDNKVNDLILRDNSLTEEEIVVLANSPEVSSIKCLDLLNQGITNKGFDSIVNSPNLQNIEQLMLQCNNDITSVFSILTQDVTKLPQLKTVVTPDWAAPEASSIDQVLKAREILKEAVIENKRKDIVISPEDVPILLAALPEEESNKKGSKEKGAIATLRAAQRQGHQKEITISKLDAQKLFKDVIDTQRSLITLLEPQRPIQMAKRALIIKQMLEGHNMTPIDDKTPTVRAAKPTPTKLKNNNSIHR